MRKSVPVAEMVEAGMMTDEEGATAKLDARLETRPSEERQPSYHGQTPSKDIRVLMTESLVRLVREVYPDEPIAADKRQLETNMEDMAINMIRVVRYGIGFAGMDFEGTIPVRDHEYEDFEIPLCRDCEDGK